MIQTRTMDCSPDHCERIDPDMSITVQQDESIGAGVVDDDDEIEVLRNSLKEMVQDQAVKPKLQCVMMDPSFSMVTIQSEDTKIVWETASSRSSSPWASDSSTTSEAHNIQGSGTAGKIIFIMDEDKIIRRKKKIRGKRGEKFKRLPPGPVTPEKLKGADERLAMAEVSVPNVSPQGRSENEEPTRQVEHKEKDLLGIDSECSEIINIIVPSRLPTVDEEESSEMAENLSYLGQTEMLESYTISEETESDSHELNVFVEATVREGELSSTDKEPLEQDASHCPSVSKLVRRDGTGGTDYFEKFPLLDETTPPDLPLEKTEIKLSNGNKGAEATENQEQLASKNPEALSLSGDIMGAHLDDIFYGGGCCVEPDCSAVNQGEEHGTKEEVLKSPLKECGSALFRSEEVILTPMFLSPGPPKIIDPFLLDEPRAMSFLYTDLYEEAVGNKERAEECSDVESIVSERSLHRQLSDADDASGYLEKYILKDETPLVEDRPTKEGKEEGELKMWPESTLEVMGFLTDVKKEAMEEITKPDEITENLFVPYEENDETVTSKKTRLEDEMFQPPAEVQESKHIQQEAVTCHEKSKDKPDEMVVEETDSTENETSAENKESQSLVEKMTENKKSKEEDISKYVPSSIAVHTGPHGAEMCIQKALMLDKVAKPDISQAVSEDTSESQLHQGTAENEEPTRQEEHKEKDLFSMVSEGSEIINIIVPSRLSTVDEEESSEMAENLSYLGQTEMMKSYPISEETETESHELNVFTDAVREEEPSSTDKEPLEQDASHCPSVSKLVRRDGTGGTDSFEKFPLLDETSPLDLPLEKTEIKLSNANEGAKATENQMQLASKNPEALSLSGDIAGAHSDYIFYGGGCRVEPDCSAVNQNLSEAEEEHGTKEEEVPKSPLKESSSALFGSENIQQEVVTCHEKSKDKPEEMVVEETDSTENETSAENKESQSLVEKMTENKESKEEDRSKYVPSSTAVDTGRHGAEICIQKALMLDEVAKTDISQAVSEDTSESQLHHSISVDTKDFFIKGKEKISQMEESSPHQGCDNNKGTDILKNKHEDIICADNKEVQCALESTTTHRLVADCDKVSKTVKQKGEMQSLSPSLPVKTVQIEKEEKVEIDSAEKEKVPSSPLEDLPECSNEAFITEPPEMYRDQDYGNVEATAYEMINQLEVGGPLETETEAVKEDKSGEQLEQGFDSVEEPTRDSSSKEAVNVDNECVEVMDETLLEEDKQENDSRMLRFRFCVVCRCIISSLNTPFGEHKGHDVSTLDKAYDDIKGKLKQWISVLQGRSEKIEDLVSELEQAYNSIENNCKTNAQSLDEQNEEMVKAVVEQYSEMSRSMAEKKRLRVEQLGIQIGTFQERIKSAKETLEREVKEAERPDLLTLVSSSKDTNKSLRRALESTLSLEPVLENYTRGPEGRGQEVLKDILVPREPYLLVQEASSATCTSITAFWRVSEEDIIDCFQVNYVEESHEAVSEVYKVTVKESYCTLEELAPDKCYRVWVMALNYAGCSLPSEKLPFRTAPSVPEIILEQSTVCWDSAIIRWSSTSAAAAETFTLEYCRQTACEGEGLRSLSGIRNNEQSVLLQPNENYLFYIRAVNFAGASEQSEAVLISTSGTRFHLLKDTASPGLVLCKDNMVHYPEEVFNRSTVPNVCQEIMGELLPPRGIHYWETAVEGGEGFRIGVAYDTTPQKGRLGENSTSWCIHCIPTSTSWRYELLHNSTQMSIIMAEVPATIGTLLDYLHGCLSFFNAQSGQLLGSCYHRFSEPCHPVLVLERPGTLALHPVTEVPDFAKCC